MANLNDVKLTKCNLKGLLLSKIGGVPLNSLLIEYKKLYDEELNFKSMGVSSLDAFLKTIPEIATVQMLNDGQTRVFGISSNDMNTTARKAARKLENVVNNTSVPKLLTSETKANYNRQLTNNSSNFYDFCKNNGKVDSKNKRRVNIRGIPMSATVKSLSSHLRYYNFEGLKLLMGSDGFKYGSILLPIIQAEDLFLDNTVKYFNGSKLSFSYPNGNNFRGGNNKTQAPGSVFSKSSENLSNSFTNLSVSRGRENRCNAVFKEKFCNRNKECHDQNLSNIVDSPSKTVFREMENGLQTVAKAELRNGKENCFDSFSANVCSPSESPSETSYSLSKPHLNFNTNKQQLIYINHIPAGTTTKTLCEHFKSHDYKAKEVKILQHGHGSALLPEEEIEELLDDQYVRFFNNSLLRFAYPQNLTKSTGPALALEEGTRNEIETGSTVENLLIENNQAKSSSLVVYVENLPIHARLEDVLDSLQSFKVLQGKMLSPGNDQEEKLVCQLVFHHIDDVIKLYRETNTLMVLDRPVGLNFLETLPEIKKFCNFDNLIITRVAKQRERVVTKPTIVISLNTKTDERVIRDRMVEYLEPSLDKLPVSMSRYSLTLMYNDLFPGQKMHSKGEFMSEITLKVTHTEPTYPNYFWGVPSMPDNNVRKVLNMNHLVSSFKPFDFRSRRAIIHHEGVYYRVWVKSVHSDTVEVFFVDYGNTEDTTASKLLIPPDEVWDVSPEAVPFRVKENSFELINNVNKFVRCLLVGTEGPVLVVANLVVSTNQ